LSSEDCEFDTRWAGAYISQQDWHFHKQLLSRYGVVLGPGQFSEIIGTIKGGQARLVKAKDGRRSIYSIRVKGAPGRVYVLALNGLPVTAWPPKAGNRMAKKAAAFRRNGGAAQAD
jgi:hypothetical protein